MYFCVVTKAEQTRQYIIEKTAPLFNKKGFDGTTLSDLTEVTGLTKGALYGNFKDKDEISVEAFRYSIAKVRTLVGAHMEGVIACKDQLYKLFDFFAEYVFDPPIPGGCPMLNTAIEADDHRVSLRKIVAKELVITVEFISSLIDKGIKKGEFRKGSKSRELAYTVFCSIEGALMFSRAERSREPMDIVVTHCKKLVDQISL